MKKSLIALVLVACATNVVQAKSREKDEEIAAKEIIANMVTKNTNYFTLRYNGKPEKNSIWDNMLFTRGTRKVAVGEESIEITYRNAGYGTRYAIIKYCKDGRLVELVEFFDDYDGGHWVWDNA